MKSPALSHRRTTSVALAGLLSAGIALTALVGPVGAAQPGTTEGSTSTTASSTTAAPTTEAPTTEVPTTEAPTTTVEPLEEGGSIGTTYMQGCTVEIPVTVEAGGTYRLTVWDDGNQIGDVSRTFSDNETGNFEYPLTQAPSQIVDPGLAYDLFGPSGDYLDSIDPPTPGADVMKNCTSPEAKAIAAKSPTAAHAATAVASKPTFTG